MSTVDGMTTWEFDTPRLHCRLVDAGCRELFHRLYADPETMAHIGPILEPHAVDALLGRVVKCNSEGRMAGRYWALSHRRTGRDVGILSLLRLKNDPMSANLGLMVLPEWKSKGVGFAALSACVDSAMAGDWAEFFDSIVCMHSVANPVAGRLVSALGFLRDDCDDPGFVMWKLDRSQWLERGPLRKIHP